VIAEADPEAERKVGEVLGNARRAYDKLTLAPVPEPRPPRIVATVEDAVAGADFIQESLPEREELKIEILARASRAARPATLIASSTSGLPPSRLQSDMTHPERFVVGHPFNPVYLLPLVEICGGARTAAQTKTRAAEVYSTLGMKPLVLRQEIDGFLADRLMEALWREALWLVHDDIATTQEIDDALRYGAGLRWSFMGTFLTYRLAGGEAGMRHFMAQFGPTLKLPWTRLTEVPELSDALVERIAEQSDAQAEGASIRELERLRDDCLISVMQGLRDHDYGVGAVLKAHEARLYGRAHPPVMADTDDPSQPLRLHTTRVKSEWVDYNGHMTESRYLQVFGDATDALLRHVGMDESYLASGFSYYTVETHIMHLREVAAGTPLRVSTQVLGADEKRLHIFHEMRKSDDDTMLASAEHMLLHVDSGAGRACPAREDIRARIARLATAHAALPAPERAGRRIAMPARAI